MRKIVRGLISEVARVLMSEPISNILNLYFWLPLWLFSLLCVLSHIWVLRREHGVLRKKVSVNGHQWGRAHHTSIAVRLIVALFYNEVVQALVNHWSHSHFFHCIRQRSIEKVWGARSWHDARILDTSWTSIAIYTSWIISP